MRRLIAFVFVLVAMGATGCFATVDTPTVHGRYFTPEQALEMERLAAVEKTPYGGQVADCHGPNCRTTAINGPYGPYGYAGAYGGVPAYSAFPEQAAIYAARTPPVIVLPRPQVIVTSATDPRVDALVSDDAETKANVAAILKAHRPHEEGDDK